LWYCCDTVVVTLLLWYCCDTVVVTLLLWYCCDTVVVTLLLWHFCCDTVVANERYITKPLVGQFRLRRRWLWWWQKSAYTEEHWWWFYIILRYSHRAYSWLICSAKENAIHKINLWHLLRVPSLGSLFRSNIYKSDFIEPTQLYGETKFVNFIPRRACRTSTYSFDLEESLRAAFWCRNMLAISKKLDCTLVQALRLCTGRTARRGSRGIALLFLDHGTRRGWGVSVTRQPLFTPRKDPVPIVQEAGWAPGPVWTGAESLTPTGIRYPDRPARSQSLYRLSYPAHIGEYYFSQISFCEVRLFVNLLITHDVRCEERCDSSREKNLRRCVGLLIATMCNWMRW